MEDKRRRKGNGEPYGNLTKHAGPPIERKRRVAKSPHIALVHDTASSNALMSWLAHGLPCWLRYDGRHDTLDRLLLSLSPSLSLFLYYCVWYVLLCRPRLPVRPRLTATRPLGHHYPPTYIIHSSTSMSFSPRIPYQARRKARPTPHTHTHADQPIVVNR